MGSKSIIGGIVGAVADYFTGGMGGFTAAGLGAGGSMDKNDADEKRMQKNMDFQDYMSSSAYQRATMDMTKAGINPMVAYQQGGASSPAGGTMPSENVTSPGISSAFSQMRLKADLDNMEAQNAKIRSDTLLNLVTADKVHEDVQVSGHTAKLLGYDIPRARNKAAPEETFIGKWGAYLDRITDSLGSIFGKPATAGRGGSAKSKR